MRESGDFTLAEDANRELAAMAKRETTETLGKVLLERSKDMKNGFNRADN